MAVTDQNPEYGYWRSEWERCRAAAGGAKAVRALDNSLPAPFEESEPERYRIYRDRAYFMGVTGRTEDALIGMVFRKPADYEIPTQLNDLIEDFDGAGNSIEQCAKEALAGRLETSRHLLFVDYPEVDENLDRESEVNMRLRPVVALYEAEALINWKFDAYNGKKRLILAVLREQVNKSDDEFSHDLRDQYRVLRMRDGVYTQQVYDFQMQAVTEEFEPLAGGQRLDHIPLHGVRDLVEPPLLPVADVNIAHYRNVADLEDAAFIVGQPTLHIDIGETSTDEFKEQNPDGVKLGSRLGIVTRKGSVEMAQASENNLIRTIKQDKEQEMIMLGAQIITRQGQAETAEAVRMNSAAEASVLDRFVSDLSEDLEAALYDCALFMGLSDAEVKYQLNTDFFESGLSPQALMAVIQGVSSRIIAGEDALNMIRSGKLQIADGRTNEGILEDVANALLD